MNYKSAQRYNISPMPECRPVALSLSPNRDCCIKANRGVAFGIRLRSHTEVCGLQTSPSAPCASSFLQSLDNHASKIVRLLTFATVSNSFQTIATWKMSNPHMAIFYSPRSCESFLPKYHLIPPKYRLIPPKNFFFSTWIFLFSTWGSRNIHVGTASSNL